MKSSLRQSFPGATHLGLVLVAVLAGCSGGSGGGDAADASSDGDARADGAAEKSGDVAAADLVSTPTDAVVDAVTEDATDANTDTTAEAGPDLAVDTGPGDATEAGADLAADKTGDAVSDAGADVSSDGAWVPFAQCAAFPVPDPTTPLSGNVRYQKNANGTVTDSVTHLVWQGPLDAGTYTQPQAAAYCANKGNGWRLPTRLELATLVDYTVGYPQAAIDQSTFPGTPALDFWTGSSVTTDTSSTGPLGWTVDFNQGVVGGGLPIYAKRNVRCVQAPAPSCDPTRFNIGAGNTVQDKVTMLTWERTASMTNVSWNGARTYCTGLGAGWRLPSPFELETIVDETKQNPAVDQAVFPNGSNDYWTATKHVSNFDGEYYYVNFFNGGVEWKASQEPDPKILAVRVRCVRP